MNHIHIETLELLKKHFELDEIENGVFIADLSDELQSCKATIDLTEPLPKIKYEITASVLSQPKEIKSRLRSFQNAVGHLSSSKFAKTDPFLAALQLEIG